MTARNQTVLLRGGPGDGSTLTGVPEHDTSLVHQGTTYVRSDEDAARPGSSGTVISTFPVFTPA